MDYIKKIEKNNVGLKTTLKEIFNDVDKRLRQINDGNSGETPSPDEGETLPKDTFIYNGKKYRFVILRAGNHTVGVWKKNVLEVAFIDENNTQYETGEVLGSISEMNITVNGVSGTFSCAVQPYYLVFDETLEPSTLLSGSMTHNDITYNIPESGQEIILNVTFWDGNEYYATVETEPFTVP